MEEKNDVGIMHVAHKHLLILNELYIDREDVYCRGCWEEIDSYKSSFVYSCSNVTSGTSHDVDYRCHKFLLHKTCAELPLKIEHPTDQNEFLFFKPWVETKFTYCIICGLHSTRRRFAYCSSFNPKIYVCVKCAILQVQQSRKDPIFVHPGHSHALALINHPSSFQCFVCKENDNLLDSSYRCTKCQFWIHKSCGDAPHSFQFQVHKHPLILSFFLPEIYHKFTQFCRICRQRLFWIEWLYCCRSCRYFTHFQCARSSPMLSSGENETYPNLVHLPAADEISLNLLLEQFIKDKITLSDSYNGNSITSATNCIKHWSHEEHDLKLIKINELYDGKNDDETLLLCDGCVKPIQTDEGQSYYGCFPCKFFMHKDCAELPREIEHHLWPGKTLFADKYSEPFKFFQCDGCEVLGNGIFYSVSGTQTYKGCICLHIGCVTLPKSIKYEAHPHQLDQFFVSAHCNAHCNACGIFLNGCMYGCKDCRFYICGECIMMAKTYKHRWDPHPLELIYDAGMVEEHEHEFDCEYCSEEIDTNRWFYHCSKCDLSFHTICIEISSYRRLKDVKFGATDIIIKDKLHPHALTFALSKKVGRCMNCNRKHRSIPVLQCAPCQSIIFCYSYWWNGWCWN